MHLVSKTSTGGGHGFCHPRNGSDYTVPSLFGRVGRFVTPSPLVVKIAMHTIRTTLLWILSLVSSVATTSIAAGQHPPFDEFPAAEPPYYRVRYEGSATPGELVYGVNYTIWIPPQAKFVRGVIVHQHGCGEGSCRSGFTGAYDLHWQALAMKHDCALLSPAYEQRDNEECQLWCDPRNGSSATFQQSLIDLGAKSGHPELSHAPWALWGHSGGGHWAGGMLMLYPDRVIAAWLRSGVPLLKPDPNRPNVKDHLLPEGALRVPIMCNLGIREGVIDREGQFAGVWPANEIFFTQVRAQGGLICVSIDPLSSHDCGNQRYLAIPWLDRCLSERLPIAPNAPLRSTPTNQAWLAPLFLGTESMVEPVASDAFSGPKEKSVWFMDEAMARAWTEYVKDTEVVDSTPPPAPTHVVVAGNELSWTCVADLESGLSHFLIQRDGKFLARVPDVGKNPFGRPLFQNLQYSDTPSQPLVTMHYTDLHPEPGQQHSYQVIAVNTVGLASHAK